MHQLQQGIRSDRTKGSPRHLSLKCSAAQTSPHYRVAILSHHRPPKYLLSKSQGPLLALMTGIMMHTIEHHAALTHRNDKGQDSLCLALQGCAHVHETLIQDETVADMEEHLALFHLTLHSEALLEEGVPPWKQCVLPQTEPLAAGGQDSICLLGLFPVCSSFTTCTLASWLKRSCSSKSSSLALASPLLASPTIAPPSRDWTVSWLWLMGTQLKVSTVPLSVPFWYSNLN